MESPALLTKLNPVLLSRWNTLLLGGFSEPLYLPSSGTAPAEIRFTRGYARSALHELAHWCIAGEERRKQVDYGYWYCPDGRGPAEQAEFYRVEVKPQALEMAFSRACGVAFEVSCDNLSGEPGDVRRFTEAVTAQHKAYESEGYPSRAGELLRILAGGTR